ncbi:hypothetical protein ACFL5K_02430 [Gemmatimonadota bacterium]
MKSLHTIGTIALFESKVLLRSWFFRIFALLALLILTTLNYFVFARPFIPWMFSGMSSYIPYLNLLLLNVVQAVVGVFMASDFLKYDRKLDTTEVIYMRSMTNADYVLGKMLGVLAVFAGLNLLMLLIGLVCNVFLSDLPVVAAPYLWYPLLISLPTVMFILGLTFLFMVIVRSQAITFIILLAYIFSTLFYFGLKYHYLFDYMAFNVPLMYSEFIGFGDLSRLLVHRGIYFLLGLGFTFTTVLMLRRLPQSRIMNRVSLVLAVVSIGGALLLGHNYIKRISDETALRKNMIELNKQIRKEQIISLNRCALELIHTGDEIEVQARLCFTNNTADPVDRYIFSLNPGLEVGAVTRNGQDIPFARNLHILYVEPPIALEPGAADSLTVSYTGVIDERVCYPDIGAEKRKESYRIMFYNMAKRYAFITPDYVLLTPESLWYPRAGLSEGAAYPDVLPGDFIEFSLRVKTAQGLKAVSQGAVTENGGGEFLFEPEVPLPQLSLAVGRYEMLSLTVEDSVAEGDSMVAAKTDYNLYLMEGHDFFSQYFTEVADTLPSLIRDARATYENNLDLEYPYRRLSLVETPIQFCAYDRDWTLGTETVQPELVLLPEKGMAMEQVNFRMMKYFMERSGRRGGNQVDAEQMQRNSFNGFVNQAFLGGSFQSRSARSIRGRMSKILTAVPYNNYSLFPNYHSYIRRFSSAEWPLFNMAMEFYLGERIGGEQEMTSVRARVLSGMSDDDRANLALMKRSLTEILASPDDEEDIYNIIKVKSKSLFNYIENQVGEEEFKTFIKEYFESQAFTDRGAGKFVDELADSFGVDFGQYLDSWLNQKKLPAYIFSGLKYYEIIEDNKTRYQILLKITNTEDIDGLIGVNFRWGDGGNFRRYFGGKPENPLDERLYTVEAGQSKEIGIVLDGEIQALWFNTYLSQNLPNSMEMQFEDRKPRPDAKAFEGERILDQPPALEEPGTIIVDNEDPAFEVHELESESFLKKLLNLSDEDRQEYIGLSQWRMPARWSNALRGEFYGKYRHSAHYIKAGKGESKVSWKAELPSSGEYDLYYHVIEIPAMRWGRGGQGGGDPLKDFHFVINHDDGEEELKIDMDGAEPGWYLIGTFYFSEGPAEVELTDQSKGTMVYADAVKWTLRE